MKVIEPGRFSKPWRTRVICSHCGAMLEVDKSDLFTVEVRLQDSYRDASTEQYPAFTCPECHHTERVFGDDIPPAEALPPEKVFMRNKQGIDDGK